MAKNGKKRVTMGDVAKAAGVSKPVVSAILKQSSKNNSRFSKETMDKVLKVVRELNYRPNRTARKFVRKQHNTVGILFNRIGNVDGQTLSMIAQWGATYDLEIVIERLQPKELPRFITQDMVDVIVVFEILQPEVEQEIENLGIPFIYINTEGNVRNANTVLFDEEDGVHQILEYFSSHNRLNPMMLLPLHSANTHYSHAVRWKALKKYSRQSGMNSPVLVEFESDNSLNGGAGIPSQIEKALNDYPETDGMIIDWSHDAISVYDILKRHGRDIPKDVSVVCIRRGPGKKIITRLDPQLTHLNIEESEVGRRVILLINDILTGKSTGGESLMLPYSLEVRGS